jgi:hypothetical protein
MVDFDTKQKELIKAWHNLALSTENTYVSYIAEWIAFNAICYNLYHEEANIERADIDRKKSKLSSIKKQIKNQNEIDIQNATISTRLEKWNIDLYLPERLFISISNNYREDVIFNCFVRDFTNWYDNNQSSNFNQLNDSLKKGDKSYIINMAKKWENNSDFTISQLVNNGSIILCETNNLKTIKAILYQVRCNIFHGEKTPGEINDDRIVKAALPILTYLVNHLISEHRI